MKNEFWYFLIHGLIDKKSGAYANFYSYGQHLGEALDSTLKNTDKVGLYDCDLIEAQRLDTFDDFELPAGSQEISNGVFFKPGLNIYKIKKEYDYIAPIGIVKSTDDGDYSTDLIKNQFVAYTKDENGIYSFTMTPDKKVFESLFFDALDYIPSVDSVAFFLESDWENDDKTELWINKSLTEKQQIVDFLKENVQNTIKNGFVSTVIYSSEGETNLVIDTHKHLKLTTKGESVFNSFGKKMMSIGFKQTKEFYSLEYGFHHWHYRQVDSMNKKDFRDYLKNKGFEILKNE